VGVEVVVDGQVVRARTMPPPPPSSPTKSGATPKVTPSRGSMRATTGAKGEK
jgi:hypothetical protein